MSDHKIQMRKWTSTEEPARTKVYAVALLDENGQQLAYQNIDPIKVENGDTLQVHCNFEQASTARAGSSQR